jgi:hypothetical protein
MEQEESEQPGAEQQAGEAEQMVVGGRVRPGVARSAGQVSGNKPRAPRVLNDQKVSGTPGTGWVKHRAYLTSQLCPVVGTTKCHCGAEWFPPMWWQWCRGSCPPLSPPHVVGTISRAE